MIANHFRDTLWQYENDDERYYNDDVNNIAIGAARLGSARLGSAWLGLADAMSDATETKHLNHFGSSLP